MGKLLVVDKVAMGQVYLPVLRFLLSVPFHHCCTLIFILLLLLSEGQAGENWRYFNIALLFNPEEQDIKAMRVKTEAFIVFRKY